MTQGSPLARVAVLGWWVSGGDDLTNPELQHSPLPRRLTGKTMAIGWGTFGNAGNWADVS